MYRYCRSRTVYRVPERRKWPVAQEKDNAALNRPTLKRLTPGEELVNVRPMLCGPRWKDTPTDFDERFRVSGRAKHAALFSSVLLENTSEVDARRQGRNQTAKREPTCREQNESPASGL